MKKVLYISMLALLICTALYFSYTNSITNSDSYTEPYIPTRDEQLQLADRMIEDPNCYWLPFNVGNEIYYLLECPYHYVQPPGYIEPIQPVDPSLESV